MAATAVSTEQMYFWLTGLANVCRGEHALLAAAEGDGGDGGGGRVSTFQCDSSYSSESSHCSTQFSFSDSFIGK